MPQVQIALEPTATEADRDRLFAVLELLCASVLDDANRVVRVRIDESTDVRELTWALKQARVPATLSGRGFGLGGGLQGTPGDRCPRCGASLTVRVSPDGRELCSNCGNVIKEKTVGVGEDRTQTVVVTFIFDPSATEADRTRLKLILNLLNLELVTLNEMKAQLLVPRDALLTLGSILMDRAKLPVELALG